MKRILIAAIIAVGIHGLLLGIEFNRIRGVSSERPKSSIVTMTLVSRQPGKAGSKLSTIVRDISGNKKEKEKEKEKRAVKATRQKKIEMPPEATNDNKKKSESDEINRSFMDAQGFIPVREAIPVYDKNPSPEYPLIARRRGFQGTVVLEVLVDRNGRVGDLRVFKSSGYKVLDRAAEKSVREWIFRSAIKGNEKVEMWVRVPVCFQLK